MSDKICIVCTNDIHCAVQSTPGTLGLEGIAGAVCALRERYGRDRVLLADSGDALGVGALGCISKGAVPLAALAACGYAAACPGNADLTFGLEHMRSLAAKSPFPFVCCNLLDAKSGNPVFAPYATVEAAGCKVAFVGAVTPLAVSALEASIYKDPSGAQRADCSAADNGTELYARIQAAVDDARADGARIVVLLAHLGQAGEKPCFTSLAVAANTTGIDLIADAHSHEVYSQRVQNATGGWVTIVQGGLKLECAHTVVFDLNSAEVQVERIEPGDFKPDDMVSHEIEAALDPYRQCLERVVATLPVSLAARDSNGGWLVRRQETNLGDLVADAWCAFFGADIALVPSWVIREDLPCGQVTMRDILEVCCLGHELACVRVSGKVLVDALSFAVSKLPRANRYWLQVSSGLSFCVQTGTTQVSDVRVNGEPVHADASYMLAGVDFMVDGGKGGFGMFASSEPASTQIRRVGDAEVLTAYLDRLDTQDIAARYGNANGQGRIRII